MFSVFRAGRAIKSSLRWTRGRRIEWRLHRARQGAAERLFRSLNGRLRDERLNETLFASLSHTRSVLRNWARP
ncbi:MAG: hypothetical protein DI605_09550 [Sphingomonas sp.]|nr:MAG: hypothetical protein DI605_09550 [Sphingomonas sp.]